MARVAASVGVTPTETRDGREGVEVRRRAGLRAPGHPAHHKRTTCGGWSRAPCGSDLARRCWISAIRR